MALNPQITKQYAAGGTKASMELVYLGCRFSFFLLLMIVIPVFINMDYLLRLWLKTVPQYTPQFLMLALIAALVNVMVSPVVTALQATGNIKVFQIVICVIMLCELPLAYLILACGGSPYQAMYPAVLVSFIGLFARFLILKKLIPTYRLRFFTFSIVLKNLFIAAVCLVTASYIKSMFDISFLSFVITSLIACSSTGLIIYLVGITNQERWAINKRIKNRILKIR